MFLRLESEYDIGGAFGGNNNQDIIEVDDNLERDELGKLMYDHYHGNIDPDMSLEEFLNADDYLFHWEQFTPNKLEFAQAPSKAFMFMGIEYLAPEWANWAAMDTTGIICVFHDKPNWTGQGWDVKSHDLEFITATLKRGDETSLIKLD